MGLPSELKQRRTRKDDRKRVGGGWLRVVEHLGLSTTNACERSPEASPSEQESKL